MLKEYKEYRKLVKLGLVKKYTFFIDLSIEIEQIKSWFKKQFLLM